MADNSIFKYARIKFKEMIDDAYSYFTARYKQSNSTFTESSAYGQTLQAVVDSHQKILYYVEDSVTELNPLTASRGHSIRGLAALSGHNPSRSVSAHGSVNLYFNGNQDSVIGSQISIMYGTKLKCLNNNLTYSLIFPSEELKISINQRYPIRCKLIQGQIESQTFTGTGEPFQTFNVLLKNGFYVEENYVKVYVNSTLCTNVIGVTDMVQDNYCCMIKTSINNGIDIIFGSNDFGKIPPLGSEIIVEYLISDGSRGNIYDKENVRYSFLDSGFDEYGNDVSLNDNIRIDTIDRITMGADPEPLALTKLLMANQSRSFVLANETNYSTFLKKLNYFSVVDVFTTFNDGNVLDDNIVYVFLIPDISKRLYKGETYFDVDIKKFGLFDDEVDKIKEYIYGSGNMVLTAELDIIQPILRKYVLHINLIVKKNYNTDNIKQTIIDKLNSYFLSFKRYSRIPKSDIIAIIESVAGVDSVSVMFLNEENERQKAIWLKQIENGLSVAEPVDIGIDSFGDIVVGNTELPVIRGGWVDRNGVYYNDGVDLMTSSSVNITIRGVI